MQDVTQHSIVAFSDYCQALHADADVSVKPCQEQ